MLCVKCGHQNPDSNKYCEKCNAMLLRLVPTGAPSTSMIDVEEGEKPINYVSPEHVYATELIVPIVEAGYNLLTGQDGFDQFREVFENTKNKFFEFEEKDLPHLLAQYESWKRENMTVELSRQMIYLLNKGSQLFKEGIGYAEEFLASQNRDSLIKGLFRMQEGNDNIALAKELIDADIEIIASELQRREMESRVDEFRARIEARKAPQSAAAQEVQEENPPTEPGNTLM